MIGAIQAAKMCGVHPATFRRWVAAGDVPVAATRREGRRTDARLFDEGVVEEFAAARFAAVGTVGKAPRSMPIDQRLLRRRSFDENGCWLWTGRVDGQEYGQIGVGGKSYGVHRLSYLTFVGPIPGDLTVDHLCFVPRCFNPEHLRLLSRSENSANTRRTFATHCARGHEFTNDNTLRRGPLGSARACKTCRRERIAARKAMGA